MMFRYFNPVLHHHDVLNVETDGMDLQGLEGFIPSSSALL